jgi:hypothetical protein
MQQCQGLEEATAWSDSGIALGAIAFSTPAICKKISDLHNFGSFNRKGQ